jgi:hypothetical protein
MAGHRKRQEWISLGLCRDCGATRGEDGTTTRCHRHATLHSQAEAARKAKQRRFNRKNHRCEECPTNSRRLPIKRLSKGKRLLCEYHRMKKRESSKWQRKAATKAIQDKLSSTSEVD